MLSKLKIALLNRLRDKDAEDEMAALEKGPQPIRPTPMIGQLSGRPDTGKR